MYGKTSNRIIIWCGCESWTCKRNDRLMRAYNYWSRKLHSQLQKWVDLFDQKTNVCLHILITKSICYSSFSMENGKAIHVTFKLNNTRLQWYTTCGLEPWLSTMQTHWSWASWIIHYGSFYYLFFFTCLQLMSTYGSVQQNHQTMRSSILKNKMTSTVVG